MNVRLLRVAELLKREIGTIFQRDFAFKDVLVTVNDVSISTDLKDGNVYLGIIGSDSAKQAALQEVQRKRGMIQDQINRRVTLKETPKLQFHVDDSVERGVRVLSILDEVSAELDEKDDPNSPDVPSEPK